MDSSDEVRVLYKSIVAPRLDDTGVQKSDACHIRLSERSWCPKFGTEDVVVDLAVEHSRAPASVPVGVIYHLPNMRSGEKHRLSLSPACSKNGKGIVPVPCGVIDFVAWNEDRQEVTVELLSASDERQLSEGVTLLRRAPIVASAFEPARCARFVVSFHLMSLGTQDPRSFSMVTPDEQVLDQQYAASNEATIPASEIYQRWFQQRQHGGSFEIQSEHCIEFRFGLENDQIPIGLEEALPFLSKQHSCELLLEPPGGGKKMLLLLIVAEAEPPVWSLTPMERMDVAHERKQVGSAYLSDGNTKFADAFYSAAVDLLQDESIFSISSADLLAAAKQLKLSSLLNLALTRIRMSKWQQAVSAAEQALAIDPLNVKALYRRGLASARQNMNEAAATDFAKAAELDPNDVNIKREHNSVKVKLRSGRQHLHEGAAAPALASALADGKGIFSDCRNVKSAPRSEGPNGAVADAEVTDNERMERERLKLTCHLMMNQMKESLVADDSDDDMQAIKSKTGGSNVGGAR